MIKPAVVPGWLFPFLFAMGLLALASAQGLDAGRMFLFFGILPIVIPVVLVVVLRHLGKAVSRNGNDLLVGKYGDRLVLPDAHELSVTRIERIMIRPARLHVGGRRSTGILEYTFCMTGGEAYTLLNAIRNTDLQSFLDKNVAPVVDASRRGQE